jgi:hypothetical protein
MKTKCFSLTAAFIVLFFPLVSEISVFLSHEPFELQSHSLVGGVCVAVENTELFSKNIAKQKEGLENELEKVEVALSLAKLQEARRLLEVLDYKINRLKKSLSKQETENFRQRIDKNRKNIPLKEDSLVAKAVGILHTQGVDAALHYTQNELTMHGVAEKKINAVEKRILKDAPAIQLALEHEEILRVIKILESGASPDSSVNPYILKTAQLMGKIKVDSLRRIERSQKYKKIEDQQRVYRAELQQAIDERKKVEERLAQRTQPQQQEIKDSVSSSHETTMKESHDSSRTRKEDEDAYPIATPLNLQTLKNQQRDAQEKVMELYGLLEKKQGQEALERFKQNRIFIAQYVDAQVFTILEQTIVQTVSELQTQNASNAIQASQSHSALSPAPSPEQEYLNRINGFLRDNDVDAAYSELKRSEKQLKKIMTKDEFKQFKKMIENAYKTRHPSR